MTILDQPHELTWGSLVLDSPVDPDVPWVCETLSSGSSHGNPEPLVVELKSRLTDGSLSMVTDHGNREITYRLRLSGLDGEALAMAEAAFMAEVLAEQASPLVWVPPVAESWPVVFEIDWVRWDYDYSDGWDYDEVYRAHRYIKVTFRALPWTRNLETTVIEALPVPTAPEEPADYETIDECDSATGWTGVKCHTSHFGAVTVDHGSDAAGTYNRVYAANVVHTGVFGFLDLVVPGAMSLAGMPYLTVDLATSSNPAGNGPAFKVQVVVAGQAYDPAAILPLDSGLRRYYFADVPDSFTAPHIRAHWGIGQTVPATRRLNVYEIGRTDRIEIDGSAGFQLARTAIVGGSVPTQAALTFSAGADPLVGSTALIYTGTSPARPLRNLLHDSEPFVPDPDMISGAQQTLATPTVYLVPVDQLRTGTYSLLARLNFTGSEVIQWSARVVDADGAAMPGSEVVKSGARLATNNTADPWYIHELAAIRMPVVELEGFTTHAVEVTISVSSGGADVSIDEAWLLDTEHGAVTVIHEPSAFQLTGIELRSPAVDAPHPAVIGTWETYGDQDISRLATSFGKHEFPPGLLHIFTATDLAKYAGTWITYYERFHTYPGPALPLDSE